MLPACCMMLHAKEDGCTFHEEAWRDSHPDGGGLIDGSSVRMVEMFTQPRLCGQLSPSLSRRRFYLETNETWALVVMTS